MPLKQFVCVAYLISCIFWAHAAMRSEDDKAIHRKTYSSYIPLPVLQLKRDLSFTERQRKLLSLHKKRMRRKLLFKEHVEYIGIMSHITWKRRKTIRLQLIADKAIL